MQNQEADKEISKKTSPNNYFILGFFILMSCIALSLSIYFGLTSIKGDSSTVTVKGSASKNIESDKAIWRGQLTFVSTNQADGYTKTKEQAKQVIDYLVKQGFDIKHIKIGHLEHSENIYYLDNGTRVNGGYKFSQIFTIESNNVDKIEMIAEKASELLTMGFSFESFYPEYLYTKLNDLKIEMIKRATADAKGRAIEIAKSEGCKVSGVASAQQGIFQITPINSEEIYDWGMNDTSSRFKTIKSVVTIKYFLK